MNTTTLDPVVDTASLDAVQAAQSQPAQSQRFIALSKLVPSPMNVRTSGGENIDELAMLIDKQDCCKTSSSSST